MVSKMTVLPFSSVRAMGVALMPPMVKVTICSSGKARPMPSTSTSGRPSRAAAAMGSMEFTPPASMGMKAYIFLPKKRETISYSLWYSSPPMAFSARTVGAPIMAMGTTSASSGTSSGSSSVTSPQSRTAPMATSLPT